MLWARHAQEGAARGMWMHLEFEALLNGHIMSIANPQRLNFSSPSFPLSGIVLHIALIGLCLRSMGQVQWLRKKDASTVAAHP